MPEKRTGEETTPIPVFAGHGHIGELGPGELAELVVVAPVHATQANGHLCVGLDIDRSAELIIEVSKPGIVLVDRATKPDQEIDVVVVIVLAKTGRGGDKETD